MRKFLNGAALILVMAASCVRPVAADTGAAGSDGARQVIEQFHASLLAVMKQAKQTDTRERYQVLAPEIAQRFDLRLMIALATGKYWRTADKASRDDLTKAFQRFSTANYASRFDGYSGQSFETLSVTAGPRKTELVKTQIVSPDQAPVPLTYVTRAVPTGWRIVDVLLDDGISELAVRRSEYASILKSDGVKGLIQLLDRKTAKLLEK